MDSATKALPEIDAQYRALREAAGLLDRSERGKLLIRGSEAAEYLQGQLTNEIEQLAPGEGCYAALLALIGPGARGLAAGPSGPEHAHLEAAIGGVACRAAATAFGVDLIVEADDAGRLSEALLGAGAVEVSEEAAEIVRVEAGLPRLGAEISSRTLPAEAGIVERAVSFTKGCYIGQETVARPHHKGKPNRHLRGLRFSAASRAGTALLLDGKEVGTVGTACISP